jgi:broad specificity phosphatase PhoE
MPSRLILIRHGRTRWNAEGRYMGSTDIDLDPEGIAQAHMLRKRFAAESVDRVYSSDRARAMNFARIIFPGMAIEAAPMLREMDFGVIEGMTHDEIAAKYPEAYSRWLSDIDGSTMPRAEPMPDFRKRVIGAVNGIIARCNDLTAALVTHGGPISVVMSKAAQRGDFWSLIPGHASVSVLEADGALWRVVKEERPGWVK